METALRRHLEHPVLARLRERRAIALLAVLAGVFLALSLAVRSPGLLEWDLAVTLGIQASRSVWGDRTAIAFTRAGDTLTLALVVGVTTLLLLGLRKPLAALLCLASVLTLPLNVMIKHWVGRARPDAASVEIILPALGLSYPSGHAMAAVTVYGFLAVLLWIHFRPVWRSAGVLALALLALGISFSRIYLGAHWLSDVIGGWTAGLFLLLLLTKVYRKYGDPELPRASG